MAFAADIETQQVPEPPQPSEPPRRRGRRAPVYLALAAALIIGFVLLVAVGVGDASAAGGCGGG